MNGAKIEPVDVIIGGSPCQDLSVAGNRAGLAGERSGLFMEQIRVVKEMRENEKRNGKSDINIRPRFMLWENVAGALSSKSGDDFHAVLEEIAHVADPNAIVPRFEGGGGGNGQTPAQSWQMGGLLLGEYKMHSFGESPNVVVESRLSQILEDKVHPKYFLSAKACRGVLRRAERRGKELPTELKQALEEQAEWLESHLDFNPEYGEINDETSNTPPPNDRTNSGNAGRGNRQADGHNAGQAAGEFRGAIGFDPSADRDVGQNVYSECESTVHNGTCPGHKCGVVLPLPTVAAFKRLQGSKAYGIGYEEETAPTLVSNAEQPSIVEINKDDKADI